MLLKNYEDRLDFLNRHLDKINKAVSDFLGFGVNFDVRTYQDSCGNNFIVLRDDTDIRDKCGVMSKCFERVYLSDFGMCFDDDSVSILVDCNWRLIGGGENGATICRISVIGDEVSVRSMG